MDEQTLPTISIKDFNRDDTWLLSRLDYLWSTYFSDVEQINPVFIKFGRFARLRFGSIYMDSRVGHSIITISGMFKDPQIPQEIVDHTIAHELCHYAQGFSSPHNRAQKFPHAGGVVQKEMEERNLLHLHSFYKSWIKEYRAQLRAYYMQKPRVRKKKRGFIILRYRK